MPPVPFVTNLALVPSCNSLGALFKPSLGLESIFSELLMLECLKDIRMYHKGNENGKKHRYSKSQQIYLRRDPLKGNMKMIKTKCSIRLKTAVFMKENQSSSSAL